MRADLYDAIIINTNNALTFGISGIERRTPCDFRLEVSDPSELSEPISVYLTKALGQF
jgi:hypothetical protein